ncbi:MAG: A/G-specific adenine glycosylase [Alphaproteobacteria bacterium]
MIRTSRADGKALVGKAQDHKDLRARLLSWYNRSARILPWRISPADRRQGRRPDPYKVWLSEIMLQQTTVGAVGPYYRSFLQRWPDVMALATATEDEVLHAWQGLGYYARARNLRACAQEIAQRQGIWPTDETNLLALPGIGPYTAAAIAAIAFDRKVVPVDGNVERVMARIFAITTPLPKAKPELRRLAQSFALGKSPGDFAQALMDLGATVCTPRQPKCAACPLTRTCQGYAKNIADELPRRAARAAKPTKYGYVFWLTTSEGRIFLRRRAPKGLLGGLMEFPSTAWGTNFLDPKAARAQAPLPMASLSQWVLLPGTIRHIFTHFTLELRVITARLNQSPRDGLWVDPASFHELALPSLMKKITTHVLSNSEKTLCNQPKLSKN